MKSVLLPFYLILEYLLILRLRIEGMLIRKTPSKWNTGTKGNVILIQGVHEKWVFLKSIGDSLNKNGFKVHILKGLGTNTKNIAYGVYLLENYLKENNLKDVFLVGHSKGGIVIKKFLSDSPENTRVKKALTIATPHSGSIFGIIFKSTKEITPKSKLLKNLKFSKENLYKTVNIYSSFDNHVVPNKSLLLEGGNNIKINCIGHTRILKHKGCLDMAVKILNDL